MRKYAKSVAIFAVSGVTLFSLAGCQNKSESERAHEQAVQLDNAADMIKMGESNVENAKAVIARGEALKSQGKDVEGDKLIADGRAQEELGKEQIAQGRRLKAKGER